MDEQIRDRGNQEAGIDETLQQVVMIASTGQRIGNMFLDMIFYYVFAFVLGIVLALIGSGDVIEGMNDYSLEMTIFLLYYVPQEAFSGRTLGKLITGTKAVNEDGTKLTFGKALSRTFCRFIPFEAFSFLGGEGRPKGWHDRIPKTKVISCAQRITIPESADFVGVPQPPPVRQAEPKRASASAVSSLVLGILGIIPFGPIASIPAVVCGHVALRRVKSANLKGKGMAIAGLVLGYASLALFCLLVLGVWNFARDITDPGGLHEAAKSGDIAQVQAALKSGANINEAKAFGTPLHFAAGFGQPEMVEHLLQQGANVDAWVDPIGTPLISAAGANRLECVKVLLKHRANVNATGASTMKGTALHHAALHGYTDVMRVLIAAGADINARDLAGRTPLDTAQFGSQEVASALLRESGAR